MKKCNKCLSEKEFSEFHKHKYQKDGYNTICKECRKPISKKYFEENNEKIKKTRKEIYYKNHEQNLIKGREKTEEQKTEHRKKSQDYRIRNLEKVKEYQKNYYLKNKEKIIKRSSEWCKKNIDKCYESKNRKIKERKIEDIIFKIKRKFRTDIYISLKRNKKNKRLEEILGVSFDEFKIYIENMFEPWMSWDNWGHNTWHIDHIIPLNSATNEYDIYKLWYYENLRPLSAKENLKKGSKLIF